MMWKVIAGKIYALFINNDCCKLKAMLDVETTQKIRFLKKEAFHELTEYIELNQLQKKYGGILPDLQEYWYHFFFFYNKFFFFNFL